MEHHLDRSCKKGNILKLFFPVTFNPSRRADFCVHQNTASCVLRHSKLSSCLKTTCPAGDWKTPSEVRVLYDNLKWICDE